MADEESSQASLPWPFLPFVSQESVNNCKNLPLQEDDIFIACFPKSGTTWTQNIVYALVSNGDESFDQISNYSPFFEHKKTWGENGELAHSVQKAFEKTKRRIFNTHLLWEMMPKESGKGKYIYLVRHGEDVMTSFFHHMSNQVEGGYEGTFSEFFDQSIDGSMAFGKWTDHIKSWWTSDNAQVLFVTYEEMKKDLRKVVDRLVQFLNIPRTKEEVDVLMERFTVKYMQQAKNKGSGNKQFQPVSVTWKKGFQFVRKGVVGDHKNHFSDDQIVKFKEDVTNSGVFSDANPWTLAGLDNPYS